MSRPRSPSRVRAAVQVPAAVSTSDWLSEDRGLRARGTAPESSATAVLLHDLAKRPVASVSFQRRSVRALDAEAQPPARPRCLQERRCSRSTAWASPASAVASFAGPRIHRHRARLAWISHGGGLPKFEFLMVLRSGDRCRAVCSERTLSRSENSRGASSDSSRMLLGRGARHPRGYFILVR